MLVVKCEGVRVKNKKTIFILSFAFEEVLHQASAFFFKHTARNSSLRVEHIRCKLAVSPFLVGSTIYDMWNLCPSDSTGTHGAWFHGYVKGAVGEVFAAKGVCCCRDCLHLGMGSNVSKSFCQVMGTRYYPPSTHYNRSYWNFALVKGSLSFGESRIGRLASYQNFTVLVPSSFSFISTLTALSGNRSSISSGHSMKHTPPP